MGIISGEGDIRKAHNCCSHWDKQRYDEIRKQAQQEIIDKIQIDLNTLDANVIIKDEFIVRMRVLAQNMD